MLGAADATDSELMATIMPGDNAQAFDELYRRYSRQLYAYYLRWTGSRQDAEDLVQETFLRVCQCRAQWTEGPNPFRSWLFAVARNAALGWLRRRDMAEASLSPALERELRRFARSASQFLEARLAACVELIVNAARSVFPAGHRAADRDWLALHIDHPPKDLFQAAVWSVQVSGRCVPEQA